MGLLWALPALSALSALVMLSSVGCHGPQHFFRTRAPDVASLEKQVRLECFTLSAGIIERWADRLPGVPLALVLQNDCERTLVIDLRELRVVALDPDGARHPLHAFDPRHELRAVQLAPGAQGQELLDFVAADGPRAAWTQVCLDASGVLPREPRTSAPAFCLPLRLTPPSAPSAPSDADGGTRPAPASSQATLDAGEGS